jgi:hypothetical protein
MFESDNVLWSMAARQGTMAMPMEVSWFGVVFPPTWTLLFGMLQNTDMEIVHTPRHDERQRALELASGPSVRMHNMVVEVLLA